MDFLFDECRVSFLISLDKFLVESLLVVISSLFLGTISLEDPFPAFYSEVASVFVMKESLCCKMLDHLGIFSLIAYVFLLMS